MKIVIIVIVFRLSLHHACAYRVACRTDASAGDIVKQGGRDQRERVRASDSSLSFFLVLADHIFGVGVVASLSDTAE